MTQCETQGLDIELINAGSARMKAVQGLLAERKLDGLVVHCEKDIQYLTGFVGHDSLLLVTGEAAFILSDSRYDEFLEPWRRVDGLQIVMGIRHRLEVSIGDLCSKRSLARVGVQAEYITVAGQQKLNTATGSTELVNTEGLVGELRMCKDALEIGRIEQAVAWAQEGITAALEHLQPGMTELQFSARIEFEMKTRGALGSSFEPIIGSGPHASIIHHLSTHEPIGDGVLLVDWGAVTPDGYCSDMTRTFGIGSMAPRIREIYAIVLEAQLAAIEACRPGITCAEVDAVARRIITNAGYGEQFGHGLGHGMGIDVHESPYFNNLQTDVKLKPGMVMTVEPGIYLPGEGGVRIEDDVLITDSGCRVLSSRPKDLASAIL